MATIPSQQDFASTQDLTNAVAVTGAQLNQILLSGYPFTDKGIISWTIDGAGNTPSVPDANTYPKWQQYLWGRLSGGNQLVTFYYWNPYVGVDATYLKWVPLFTGSIGAGTITGTMIAPLTVTDNNIANVNASKIIGGVVPTGAAGGSLIGSYPNPQIAALAVYGTMLIATDGQGIGDINVNSIATAGGLNPVGASGKLQVPVASPYKVLQVNAASAQLQWATDYFTILSNVTGIGATGQFPVVNPGATGLVWQAIGAAYGLLMVNAAGNGFTPVAIGTAYQLLGVNSTATGYDFVTQKNLVIGTSSVSTATLDMFTTGATVAATNTTPHGLGVVPSYCKLVFLCVANDVATGYGPGQEIDLGLVSTGTLNDHLILGTYCDATNINIVYAPTAAAGFKLCPVGSGAPVNPTSYANFKLKAYYAI